MSLDVTGFTLAAPNASTTAPNGYAQITLDGVWTKSTVVPSAWFANLSIGRHSVSVELFNQSGIPAGARAVASFSVSPSAPRISILSPSAGALINSSSLGATAFVAAGGPGPAPWVEWSLDGVTLGSTNQTLYAITGIFPGPHRLKASLVSPVQEAWTPAVWDEAEFSVKPGAPFIRISSPGVGASVRFEWAVLFVVTHNFSLTSNPSMGGGTGKYRILVDSNETGFGVDAIGIAMGLSAGVHQIAVELTDPQDVALSPRVWDEIEVRSEGLVPTIRIVSPANGTVYWGTEVTIAVEVENFTVSEAEDGHVDYYVDEMLQAMIPDVRYTTSALNGGPHRISVGLSPPGHVRYPVVEPSVDVVVVPPPMVKITAPSAGATFDGTEIQLKVEAQGMDLVDPGTLTLLDAARLEVFVDNASRGFMSGREMRLEGVAPGEHQIRVVAVDGSGSPIPGGSPAAVKIAVRPTSEWPVVEVTSVLALALAGGAAIALRRRGRRRAELVAPDVGRSKHRSKKERNS